MPKEVYVWDTHMQDILYPLRKHHLGDVEIVWLKASEGFVQGAPFARISVEAAALRECHIGG